MTSPNKLTQLTRNAKERIEKDRQEREKAEREKQLAEERAQEARADRILAGMTSKCLEAALQGKNSAAIMDLKLDVDFTYSNISTTDEKALLKTYLGGAANLVFESCIAQGFKVKTRHWHDGVGTKDGWKLVVSWPE
jgi:hypothetical protein